MNENELIGSQSLEAVPFSAVSANFAEHSGPKSALDSNTVAALAHDARNLITALGLYCDLLDEPGVLAPPFVHYGNELRLVAAAGRCLVSKIVSQTERESGNLAAALPDLPAAPWLFPASDGETTGSVPAAAARLARQRAASTRIEDEFAPTPITNLAAELLANRNLLGALAGPGIAVTVDAEGGARGIQLTAEDLTRILVNLVKNAADAMPSGGRIHISLTEAGLGGQFSAAGSPPRLLLAFEDNGPGIPPELLTKVFDRGVTTQAPTRPGENWSTFHRGLGLTITRSIIESACGRIEAANRPGGGASFLIELPAL
jgi:signal transduction histidine kinase